MSELLNWTFENIVNDRFMSLSYILYLISDPWKMMSYEINVINTKQRANIQQYFGLINHDFERSFSS